MSQPQATYQEWGLAADRDAQVRLLQKAVDNVETAKNALRDFMNASECWHWHRDFLDVVCDAQNALIGLQNSVGWDQIEAESNTIERG